MFNIFSRSGAIILTTLYLSGCTNTPDIVEADIPLVHSSLAYSIAPDTDNVAISIPTYKTQNNTLDSIEITVNGEQFVPIKQYMSVTGQQCIRFMSQKSATHARGIKRTACLKEGQWTLLKQLVASVKNEAKN